MGTKISEGTLKLRGIRKLKIPARRRLAIYGVPFGRWESPPKFLRRPPPPINRHSLGFSTRSHLGMPVPLHAFVLEGRGRIRVDRLLNVRE